MKSISIYSYLNRYVIVPNQKAKSGFIFSANKFIVSDDNIKCDELWSFIQEGLNQFEILNTEYDRNSLESKEFNKNISKSVGAKSYKQFWQNSQLITLVEKNELILIQSIKRASGHKSYQGSFLPYEEFEKKLTEQITNRVLELFKLMKK